MILEYISLIDINKCFACKKYVIYISRDQTSLTQADDVQTTIMELKKALFDRLEINQIDVTKRNESIEKNIRIISKQNNNVKN